MKNGLLKLYANDYVKGLIVAIFASIFATLYNVVFVANFDLFVVDWSSVLRSVTNASVVAFFSYLAKNSLTANNGSFLNITPKE